MITAYDWMKSAREQNNFQFLRSYNLRNDNHLGLISSNTTRFYNTFIPSSIVVYNNELL